MVEDNSGVSTLEDVQRVQKHWDAGRLNAQIYNDALSQTQKELIIALQKYSLSAGPEGSALRVQLYNFSTTNPNGKTQNDIDITRMLETVKNPKGAYTFEGTGGILICSSSALGLFGFADGTYTPLIESKALGIRMQKAVVERDINGELSSLVIYGHDLIHEYDLTRYPSLDNTDKTRIVRIARDGKKESKGVDPELLGFFQYGHKVYSYDRRSAQSLEGIMNGESKRVPFRFDDALHSLVARPKVLSLGSTPSGNLLYALTEEGGNIMLYNVILKHGKFCFIDEAFGFDGTYVEDTKSVRIVPDEKGTMLVVEGLSEGPEAIHAPGIKRKRIDYDKEEDGRFPRRENIQELVTVLGNTSAVAHIKVMNESSIHVYRIDTKNPELVDVLPIPANVRASSTLTTITQEHVEILRRMKIERRLPEEVFV